MGSGFIYLIIIGMWAAYFLPQWLSKHEDNSGRAIQRYKNAMPIGFLDLTTSLIPLTATLIYLVNVRKQVVASQLKMRRLKALEKITSTKIPTPIPSESIIEKNNNEHWIPFSERTEITGVIVVPKDRKGWQPTTIPKPVYTTAAKAVPSKRIIDLTSTGEWSAEQERIKALSGRDDDLFDQSLLTDGIEEDRAVNE